MLTHCRSKSDTAAAPLRHQLCRPKTCPAPAGEHPCPSILAGESAALSPCRSRGCSRCSGGDALAAIGAPALRRVCRGGLGGELREIAARCGAQVACRALGRDRSAVAICWALPCAEASGIRAYPIPLRTPRARRGLGRACALRLRGSVGRRARARLRVPLGMVDRTPAFSPMVVDSDRRSLALGSHGTDRARHRVPPSASRCPGEANLR
jgi:hypothetical protein